MYESIDDSNKGENDALIVDSEKAENGEAQTEETTPSEQKKVEQNNDLRD